MNVKSLEIKNKSNYYYDDIVHANEFDKNLIKVNERESRSGSDIYYIGYIVNKPQYNINSVSPLYLILKDVKCTVEKIEGSSDHYLVIDLSNKDVLNVFDMFNFISDKINKIDGDVKQVHGYIRLKFNSDVINIFSFTPKKLSVKKVRSDDLGIYYIYYDEDSFYLVIDDLKGYFKKNDDNDNKYLNLIFKDKKQEQIFDSIWNKIRELISKTDKFDHYSKEYTVVSFDSDDVLEYGTTIDNSNLSIVIWSVFKSDGCFYPQVYLNTCQYKK